MAQETYTALSAATRGAKSLLIISFTRLSYVTSSLVFTEALGSSRNATPRWPIPCRNSVSDGSDFTGFGAGMGFATALLWRMTTPSSPACARSIKSGSSCRASSSCTDASGARQLSEVLDQRFGEDSDRSRGVLPRRPDDEYARFGRQKACHHGDWPWHERQWLHTAQVCRERGVTSRQCTRDRDHFFTARAASHGRSRVRSTFSRLS
jgi:hypothetical protein